MQRKSDFVANSFFVCYFAINFGCIDGASAIIHLSNDDKHEIQIAFFSEIKIFAR